MREYQVYQAALNCIKRHIKREAERLSFEKRLTLPQPFDFKILQELVDREKPRYVNYEYDGCPVYDIARCPECGRYFEADREEHYNYCPDCGQRLNWEFRELEEDEEEE